MSIDNVAVRAGFALLIVGGLAGFAWAPAFAAAAVGLGLLALSQAL